MKIEIPVDEKTLESNVCVSFGRTPYFLIYDVETKESIFIDRTNQDTAAARMTNFVKDNQFVFNIGKGVEFAKINAFTASIA